MNRLNNYEGYDTKIFLKKVNLDFICTICSSLDYYNIRRSEKA